MQYELQKIILEKGNVYNILFDSNLLGHVLAEENSIILIQTDEMPIVPLAEAFGFSGEAYLATENGYSKIILNPTPELQPIFEYKVVNLPGSFLTEEVT